MKRKLRPFVLFFSRVLIFTLLLNSCENESDVPVDQDEAPVPEALLEDAQQWFQGQTNEPGALSIRKSHKVLKPVWTEAKLKKLSDGRSIIIAPAKEFVLQNKKRSVFRGFAFLIQNNTVREGKLLEFYGAPNFISTNKSKLMSKFAAGQLGNFTGGIVTYDVNYRYVSGFEYKDGKQTGVQVKLKGKSQGDENSSSAGRTMSCWDVYYVTYYSDGSEDWDYMYSYCDDQGGSENPGGGGGNGGDPGSDPSAGDTRVIVDPDGVETLEEWMCNDNGVCWWFTHTITLPVVVVEADRIQYSYLPLYPADGQMAFGGWADMAYTYDGNQSAWVGEYTVVVDDGDAGPRITDINQYLACFNEWYAGKITIYVDQPYRGRDDCSFFDLSKGGVDVGHTFIGIEQGDNVKILGFYPTLKATPLNPIMPGKLNNNSGHDYDVAVTVDVTAAELMTIVNYYKNHAGDLYDLNYNNCSNFAVDACESAGLDLPDAPSTWPMGPYSFDPGICPGKLGEALRNFSAPERNSTVQQPVFGNSAPANFSTCN